LREAGGIPSRSIHTHYKKATALFCHRISANGANNDEIGANRALAGTDTFESGIAVAGRVTPHSTPGSLRAFYADEN